MGFSGIDYAILVIYLIGTAALGFYFARFQKSARDYFLGSRDMPWPAVSLSIVATETSTLTFIGIPALSYGSDMTFIQITFGYFIARILISLFFIPAYYQGELYTAYAFLEKRFGARTRDFASGTFMVTRLFADGVRLFATAIPLKILTGLSYPTSIAIICAVTIVYTYLGGLRAVIWMDAVQIVIYLAGAAVAFMVILGKIPGGWEAIHTLAAQADKFKMFDFEFSWTTTYTIFSGLIGGAFLTMATHGTDQLIVQRLLACKNVRDSQKALISSGFLIILQFLFFLTLGVMLYAFYQTFPDRLSISRNDEVFPLFIAREMPTGIGGLLIAAIFAAAMSTLSSSLNSLASSTMMDWIKPYLRPNWSEKEELFFSRLATIAWAVLLIGVAAMAGSWGNVLEAGLKIASFTYGGLLGAFLLGLSSKRIGQREAILAMLVGLSVMLYVSTTAIAWPWYVAIGAVTAIVSGHLLRFAFSLVGREK